MRIITGSTGTTHVTSNDDGEFNQAIFGNGLIVFENGNQLSASIVDNNTIRVADGDLILQGRHALIAPNTTEDIVIETGTVGINRNDLIVARYVLDSATGYETITLEVLKGAETSGEAVDPKYTTGDIRTGDMLVEAPLYRVKIEGINIVKLESLFEVTEPIVALINVLNNNLTNNSNAITELNRNFETIKNNLINSFKWKKLKTVTGTKAINFTGYENEEFLAIVSVANNGYYSFSIFGVFGTQNIYNTSQNQPNSLSVRLTVDDVAKTIAILSAYDNDTLTSTSTLTVYVRNR